MKHIQLQPHGGGGGGGQHGAGGGQTGSSGSHPSVGLGFGSTSSTLNYFIVNV